MGYRPLAEVVADVIALRIRWSAMEPSAKANPLFRKLARTTAELREHGDEGLKALQMLLKHERPEVRSWAGACLLVSHPDEAIPVLEAIENLRATQALLSFSAEMCLKEYRLGRFKPPA